MKKMNNKGFSLVELIIVIAIMAILIVVLAPQYLKYVERSRNSTDMQNATTIVDAIQIWAADPEAGSVAADPAITTADNGAVITITATGGSVAPGAGGSTAGIEEALEQASVTLTNIHCASRTAWTQYTITVTVADGNVTFAYGPADFNTRMSGN